MVLKCLASQKMEGRKNGIMEEIESWDSEKVIVTSRVTTSRTKDLRRIDLINSSMPFIDQYNSLYTIQSLPSTQCPQDEGTAAEEETNPPK